MYSPDHRYSTCGKASILREAIEPVKRFINRRRRSFMRVTAFLAAFFLAILTPPWFANPLLAQEAKQDVIAAGAAGFSATEKNIDFPVGVIADGTGGL